jgi:ATP-binding cassette subfamily B protein
LKNKFQNVKWILIQIKPSMFFLSLIVILGGITSIGEVYRAVILKKLFDSATNAQFNKMISAIVVLGILIISDIIIRGVCSSLSARSSAEICNNIQRKTYSNLTNSNLLEFSKYHSGDILTRMTSDVDAVTNMIVNILPNIISLVILITASFITLLFYDATLAVIIIVITPIPILISRIYAKKIKKIYMKVQQVESRYRSFLNESMQNMLIIKSFCLEKTNNVKIRTIQKSKLDLALKRNNISVLSNSILSLGYWIGFFIVFSRGALKLSKGTISFGTITATLQLIGNIQGPFSALAYSLPQIVSGFASSDRLIELDNLNLDFTDSLSIDIDSAGIEFKNIVFSYKKDTPVLKEVSSYIYPGEIAALIGPSGQGKTTLIRLLLSLYKPDKGHVYITHNKEKYEVGASTRKLISYVPQGNTLFSGTIADNLRYGSPNATDKELEIAARDACAWNFIKELQDGLYTVLGERGIGLSEGQAQRLAIARALLRKTPILILDEATSSLDTETEINVLRAIQNLHPIRTCIIITHRLTALKICDRILKIENKNLIELDNYRHEDAAIDVI